jgi:hypothetical protein
LGASILSILISITVPSLTLECPAVIIAVVRVSVHGHRGYRIRGPTHPILGRSTSTLTASLVAGDTGVVWIRTETPLRSGGTVISPVRTGPIRGAVHALNAQVWARIHNPSVVALGSWKVFIAHVAPHGVTAILLHPHGAHVLLTANCEGSDCHSTYATVSSIKSTLLVVATLITPAITTKARLAASSARLCDDHFHGLLRSGIKITAVVEPIDCDVVLSIPTIVIIVIITSVIVIIIFIM